MTFNNFQVFTIWLAHMAIDWSLKLFFMQSEIYSKQGPRDIRYIPLCSRRPSVYDKLRTPDGTPEYLING